MSATLQSNLVKSVGADLTTAFHGATVEVFRTMLGQESIRRVAVPEKQSDKCQPQVSGRIGLSGQLCGDVLIAFDAEVALQATGALLGSAPEELAGDVIDAVGEITNMIAGAAKGALERYEMDLALPSVAVGQPQPLESKSAFPPIQLAFESDWGSFSIDIGLAPVNG